MFSHVGALAVGVPGEVSAMYRAWREHGKLQWKDLVKPTIDLCKTGFPIANVLYEQMQKRKQLLYNDTGFRCVYGILCYEDGNNDDYGVDNDLLLISGHFSNTYSEVRYEFSYIRFYFSKFWGVLK